MSGLPLVLDAAGLGALASAYPPETLRALLAEASRRSREVIAPTLVCAEVARGRSRTRALEGAVSQHRREHGERPALRLVDTDFALARQVGAILEASGAGRDRVVDAHVVAVCVPAGGGLVVTSDPDDIAGLAAAVPAARIRTTRLTRPTDIGRRSSSRDVGTHPGTSLGTYLWTEQGLK
ncbi:MAG: PIN domain-containing protein [Acidimicrobiales bacterium]